MPEEANTAADAPPDMAALLSELAAGNPRIGMLLNMLKARQPAESPPDPAPEDAVTEQLLERLENVERRFAQLQLKTRSLLAAHRIATDRLGELAAALGACGRCWGEDPHCPSCRGRGAPGMVRPDLELRERLFPNAPRHTGSKPPAGRSTGLEESNHGRV